MPSNEITISLMHYVTIDFLASVIPCQMEIGRFICNGVVAGASKDTDPGSGVGQNGDHSRRTAAIRFYLLSSRQFLSTHKILTHTHR